MEIGHFTEDNIKLIRRWMTYLANGHFGNARDIVDTYNYVFNGIKRKQDYTNCGSCLRRYVKEMFNALERYENENKIVEEIKEENGKSKRGRRSVSSSQSREGDSNDAS